MTRQIFRGKASAQETLACTACGYAGTDLILRIAGGITLQLCPDVRLRECVTRYRKGLSPAGYQNYLRAMAAVQSPSIR